MEHTCIVHEVIAPIIALLVLVLFLFVIIPWICGGCKKKKYRAYRRPAPPPRRQRFGMWRAWRDFEDLQQKLACIMAPPPKKADLDPYKPMPYVIPVADPITRSDVIGFQAAWKKAQYRAAVNLGFGPVDRSTRHKINWLIEYVNIETIGRQAMSTEVRNEELMTALSKSISMWIDRKGHIRVADDEGKLKFEEGYKTGCNQCPLCALYGFEGTDTVLYRAPNCAMCVLPCCMDSESPYDDIIQAMVEGDAKDALDRMDNLVKLMREEHDKEAAKPTQEELDKASKTDPFKDDLVGDNCRVYVGDLVKGHVYQGHYKKGDCSCEPFIYLGESNVNCCWEKTASDKWVLVYYLREGEARVKSIGDLGLVPYDNGVWSGQYVSRKEEIAEHDLWDGD